MRTTLRRLSRLARLALHLLLGVGLTLAYAPRDTSRPFTPRHRRIISWWLGRLCNALGVRVTVQGKPAENPALLVSNHVSWLDIPLIGGQAQILFLSKAEVRGWPLVGWLAAKAGTLFIERGGKNAANAASEVITFQLLRGRMVQIFPEGTTTDGTGVRRFHPRLFAAAQLSERAVQPVALRYLTRDGQPHPAAPFIGDDTFPGHLWRLLGAEPMEAQIHFLPPIGTHGKDRRTLADEAYEAVRGHVEGTAPQGERAPGV